MIAGILAMPAPAVDGTRMPSTAGIIAFGITASGITASGITLAGIMRVILVSRGAIIVPGAIARLPIAVIIAAHGGIMRVSMPLGGITLSVTMLAVIMPIAMAILIDARIAR
jgi:hypothetical protein